MKVLIARHGRTDENEAGLFSGNSNGAQLIEKGIKHAENLAKLFKNFGIQKIFSSPLDRAKDTAKPISDLLGLKINFNENLREMDFGELDGKLISGYFQKESDKVRHEIDHKFPRGESYMDVIARAELFIEELLKEPLNRILIVGHGRINEALIEKLGNQKDKDLGGLTRIHQPNKIVYEIDTETQKVFNINTETRERKEGILFKSKK